MKLTVNKLSRIIREETQKVLKEARTCKAGQQPVGTNPDGTIKCCWPQTRDSATSALVKIEIATAKAKGEHAKLVAPEPIMRQHCIKATEPKGKGIEVTFENGKRIFITLRDIARYKKMK